MRTAAASDFDRHMMDIALTLARRGLGTTAPNPSVGAVIADEATGCLIARGMTQPGGRPHAETQAIARAGARAKGATLYVTLEPCSHHGKTPPCVDAVIAAGIARVVIAVDDPDERVAGCGIARLEAAGLRVEVGLGAEAGRWITLGHILRVTQHRPFVQLKMALGRDGLVPRGQNGQAVFVTSGEARAAGHRLRAEADALLVGAGTARDDDPELTCRLPGFAGRSPVRVVLSRTLDLPPGLKLVRSAREVPTWIVTGADAAARRGQVFEDEGVRILPLPDGFTYADGLAALAEAGVTRLLVEGGPGVWRAAAAEGLADEIALFAAGAAEEGAPAAEALAARYAPGLDLAFASERRVGTDRLTMLRVRAPR